MKGTINSLLLYFIWVMVIIILSVAKAILDLDRLNEFTILVLTYVGLIIFYGLFCNYKLNKIEHYLKQTGQHLEIFTMPYFIMGFTFKSAAFLLSSKINGDQNLYVLKLDFQRCFWFSIFLVVTWPFVLILLNKIA